MLSKFLKYLLFYTSRVGVAMRRGLNYGRGTSDRRRRYRVAFYVPWIGPLLTSATELPAGGAETQIFLLARVLASRGVAVCLIVFDIPGVSIPSSVENISISVRPPYKARARLGKLLELATVTKTILATDADVIVTRAAGPHVGIVGLAARARRSRFIYSSANLSDFNFSRLSPKRINNWLFTLGIRLADELVVQTEEQVHLCEERFSHSPLLIKSISEPAPQRSCHPEAFLWVGRFVWYKKPLAFVELARMLPEQKFWMLTVPIPDSERGAELVSAFDRAVATAPNLELLAPRPRHALMDLVDRAVAIVNTADFEGMPNVFLEGWARGVPALSLTYDPGRVIERHQLGGFAHGSIERLAELARALWDERDNQAALAARCRQYVIEQHSAQSIGARWRDVIERLAPPLETQASRGTDIPQNTTS